METSKFIEPTSKEMEVTHTTVPIDVYALCLHCGFEACTSYCQHELASVNGHRAARSMGRRNGSVAAPAAMRERCWSITSCVG